MPEGHRITLKTPLEDGKLLIRSMSASEALSQISEYELELQSSDENLVFEDLLGQTMTVTLELHDGGKRHFHGHVTRFEQVGRTEGLAEYRATLRPWPWMLSQRHDCRIFQEQSVPEIIKEVFRELGFSDFEEALSSQYDPRVYCVQYRESDLDFVMRLMEEEGIYFFFKHSEDKHVLVLADSIDAHEPFPGYDTVEYFPPTQNAVREKDTLDGWRLAKVVQSGKFALRDFDFERPKVDLTSKLEQPESHESADFEVFDYPGRYVETQHGDTYAKTRIEEIAARHERARATGNPRGAAVGYLFTLEGHPREDQNREHLVVECRSELVNPAFETGRGADSAPIFRCSFTAMDSKRPFRPERVTPKSVVKGPQTAIVVGKSGEEIWTDKHGRVKVQFHWDRYGSSDENSSCWVRVAQLWAGKGWGGIHVPRIGQEVVVEFLEGDPDRPIITGRVYNGESGVPYALPANQTQSGIKSCSSKGAGPSNFNEIRMEDKKGSEELYVQAEKDHRQLTKNNRSERVGNDRSLSVGHDKSESIGNSKTIDVAVDHTETIGSNKTLSVGASHNETIGADKQLNVGAGHTESIGANMTITVGASLTETVAVNYAETVGGAMELTIGGAFAETVGGAKAQTIGGASATNVGSSMNTNVGSSMTTNVASDSSETVGSSKSVKVGSDLTEAVSGKAARTVDGDQVIKAKKILLGGNDEIVLQAGSSKIIMKKNGEITIEGKKIGIKASSQIVMKAKKILQN